VTDSTGGKNDPNNSPQKGAGNVSVNQTPSKFQISPSKMTPSKYIKEIDHGQLIK